MLDLATAPQTLSQTREFFRGGGRLRLSLTKRCNLTCRFCHREGGLDKNKMYIDADTFARVANECFELGGVEVNLTGGEPTLFSDLARLIDGIDRPQNATLSLTTNGCDIAPLLQVERKHTLSKLNVSLHGTEPEFLRNTISKRYDLVSVRQNIRELSKHYPVCINFSLMKDNADQLISIFEFARELEVNMKIINFQEISWNRKRMGEQFIPPSQALQILADTAGAQGHSVSFQDGGASYGAQLDVIKIGQMTVSIIDGNSWHQSMKVCSNCRHATICKEGFYAIRLYSDGTLAPCLHREDLVVNFDALQSLEQNVEHLLVSVL